MVQQKHSKMWYSFALLLLLCTWARGQSKDYCDSIEKKGEEAFFKQDYKKSLQYSIQARTIAEKKHWDKQLFNAIFNIGNTYYSMLDFGEALNYFLEAYTIAIQKLGPAEETRVLNNIANLYTKEKRYDKAREYYLKAYETAKEHNLDKRKGLPLMNVGYIYNLLKEPVKARPYIVQSIPFLEGTEHYYSAKILLVENDMLLGKSVKSRNDALSLYNSLPRQEQVFIEDFTWPLIAKTYLQENNFPEAVKYATRVLKPNQDLDAKRDTYQLLSAIYQKSGNYNRALQYRDSVITVEKAINDIKNGRQFENNRVKFEIQNYKYQISVKEEKIKNERNLFYSVLAAIIALVIILVLVLRQKKMLAERRQHITALDLEREKTHSLQLEQQITTALLEQERLKNEVENRNRKLSAKALYLSGRNELIEEFVTYLSKKPRLAKDPTIVNYIHNLKTHLKTDNEWDNFIAHFEEVNHGFLARLKSLHPSLNANDIRFIAYTYMNLSIKEIAFILNITVVACKKRKERIAAKMEISKNVDLFDYISTL